MLLFRVAIGNSMKPITIHNGDFTRIGEVLATLSPDTAWVVTIKERKENKTLAQLRTVHGWFRYIATEYAAAGGKYFQPETWKEELKGRFGLWVDKETFKGSVSVLKSLEHYNIAEMAKFMEDVNHFVGSEFNIFVPLPGDQE